MNKVTIDRELLERANSLLCSYSSTLTDRAVTRRAISEICAILAAPRQPECEAKPDRNKAFDACPDSGCDWGSFWQGWKSCHADAQRAIAELRDRLDVMTQCADNYSRMFEESAEECERLRAVLEGAEYPNIDRLKTLSVETCREVGRTVGSMTKALQAERDTLRQQLAERDAEIERLREAQKNYFSVTIQHGAAVAEAQAERDTLRQQIDKLAGLLREAHSAGRSRRLTVDELYRIDAALAEVSK